MQPPLSGVRLLQASSQAIDECGPCPLAPKCSGEYKGKGCDGTGKIQGGIATVPFLSWWPIKVFRPCPSYLAAGYVYRREGQTLDQVLFSEPSTKMKEAIEKREAEEAREAAAKSADNAQAQRVADADLSEADKLLQDRFGPSSGGESESS